ncbi:M15 family metallopeptidase [Streptomyces sp. NBC_01142]|uniref:M15 family metallopeptidase n=1 Tax=Streptomyces sp. NBC_01142 TaxID=2975865 RepID=UPI00224E0DEA|nr:M15 family metallopeptidase [Streptomyces sp. NBC_01142]MCX4820327.1 M15 family metallopeptidase [Streptomyces sp. NBC_01142]
MDIARRTVVPVLALSLVLATAPAQATAIPAPRLAAHVADVPQAKLGASYQRGCPVPPGRLRLIEMNHWGFDGSVHRGELIVHQDVVRPLLRVFAQAFDGRFPIRRMRVMAEYGGSDAAAMADDNTSAFNCRRVTGDPRALSRHSYGDAVDINPLENPYVDGSGGVHPAAGARYLDRDRPVKGMIVPGDVIMTGMNSAGWQWGGRWQPPDFQHFSADGT